MSRIVNLRIKNFRCFQNFEASFGNEHFIVLIGRGDSGKSAILKAIDALLSPQWNYSFTDWDFYNGDVSTPIIIEGDITELPNELLTLDGCAFNYKLLTKNGEILTDLPEEEDDDQPLITLRLAVDETLEPKWYIVSGREGVPDIEIRSKERELFKSFMVSDSSDIHFSYHRQSPLSALANNSPEEKEQINHKMISVVRSAFKSGKEGTNFEEFNLSAEKVLKHAKELGIGGEIYDAQLDYKENAYTLRNVGLHKDNLPCRLLGNGSKRLISMAIQLELTKQGGIVLVDEIEQGLEPDRIVNIIKLFKNNNCGQMILTTHSSHVICECSHHQLRRVSQDHSKLWDFGDSFISVLRSLPEIFFAKKVLLTEGKTEVGLLRAIDSILVENGDGFSQYGIALGNCKGGDLFYQNAQLLKEQNVDVCIVCDNDVRTLGGKYQEAILKGITVIRWGSGNSLEEQVFQDVDHNTFIELIKLAYEINPGRNLLKEISLTDTDIDTLTDDLEIRKKIGEAAKSKNWFKDISRAEALSNCIFKSYLTGKTKNGKLLYQKLDELLSWVKR
jgi:putative ATP-dependent endonuclease of OLD family